MQAVPLMIRGELCENSQKAVSCSKGLFIHAFLCLFILTLHKRIEINAGVYA